MMLNPFDLRGPEFLLFYAVLAAAAVVFARRAVRSAVRSSWASSPDLSHDPYEIAYLQGGPGHTLHVALLSLIDRGLLEVHGTGLEAAGRDSDQKVRRSLERVLLRKFVRKAEASEVFSDSEVKDEVEAIGDKLRSAGLLADSESKARQRWVFWGSLAALWGIAGIKIVVAFQRGHHNILFLVALAVIAALVLRWVTRSVRSGMGDQELARLRDMFSGLHDRRKQLRVGGFTHELALLAALFGMSALPAAASKMVKPLRFHRETSSGCGSGCAGGSSCSGGSCGGGCGGGCGGCGG